MKVLACPFCDSEDVSVYKSWNLAYYFATCEMCGSCGSNKETEKEAIESWNRVCSLVSYGKEFEGMMLDAEETRGEIDKELEKKEGGADANWIDS